MNESVHVEGEGTQPLLVFSDDCRSMGLLVDEIVDIVDDRLDIEVASESPGVLGSAVIKGRPPKSSTSPISCRWLSRTGSAARSSRRSARSRAVLLIDDSAVLPQYAGADAAGRGLRGERGRHRA